MCKFCTYMGTEYLAWVLYSEVLHLEYSIQWWLWITAPVAGALLHTNTLLKDPIWVL